MENIIKKFIDTVDADSITWTYVDDNQWGFVQKDGLDERCFFKNSEGALFFRGKLDTPIEELDFYEDMVNVFVESFEKEMLHKKIIIDEKVKRLKERVSKQLKSNK